MHGDLSTVHTSVSLCGCSPGVLAARLSVGGGLDVAACACVRTKLQTHRHIDCGASDDQATMGKAQKAPSQQDLVVQEGCSCFGAARWRGERGCGESNKGC